MRLIDSDELIEQAYRKRLDSRELIAQMIESSPTIDAIPISELLKLRDWLYESDGITMGGLRSLNELIAKYSSNLLPRIENGFERR